MFIVLPYNKALIKVLSLVLFCMMFSSIRAALEHAIPQQDNQGEFNKAFKKAKVLCAACDPQLDPFSLFDEVSFVRIAPQRLSTEGLKLVCFGNLRQEELQGNVIVAKKRKVEEERYINSFFVKEAFEEPKQKTHIEYDKKKQEERVLLEVENQQAVKDYLSEEDRALAREADHIVRELRKQGISNPRQYLSPELLKCFRAVNAYTHRKYSQKISEKKRNLRLAQ